jgi:hypothetical protein
MASQGRNEGFHVLDEFVCEAIHAPSVPLANPANQGQNQGLSVVEELVVELGTQSGTSDEEDENQPQMTEEKEARATHDGKGLRHHDTLSDGQSAAFSTENPQSGPDLARLIEAWPALPDHIRKAILGLVETAK